MHREIALRESQLQLKLAIKANSAAKRSFNKRLRDWDKEYLDKEYLNKEYLDKEYLGYLENMRSIEMRQVTRR